MIKMTYHQTRQGFREALMKLAHQQLPGKVSYNIKRLVDAFKSQERKILEEYHEQITKKFAKKDEKGEFIRPEGDPEGYDVDETKEKEVRDATEEFGKKEFTIDRNQLNLADFMNVNISAAEFSILDPIFFDPSEETAKDNVTVIPKKA